MNNESCSPDTEVLEEPQAPGPQRLSLFQFKCCGSNSSADWQHSAYILSQEAEGRRVPDSCCKTVVVRCGQRVHPSNIYKVEVSAQLQPSSAMALAIQEHPRPPREAGLGRGAGRGDAGNTYSLAFNGLHKALGDPGTPWHALGHSRSLWAIEMLDQVL